MIIVEGPDGSGKTTLIERLGFQAIKYRALRSGLGATDVDGKASDDRTAPGWGGSEEAFIAYMREVLHTIRNDGGKTIAFDRFHLSECVYGPILRGASGVTRRDLKALRESLQAYFVPVILCLPPLDVTLKIVTREGRERPAFQTDDFLRRAYKGWDTMRDHANIVYDFTESSDPAWVKKIIGA